MRLLAALALNAAHLVGVDRLVDVVWHPEAPATARRQIQDLISRLRRDIRRFDGTRPGVVPVVCLAGMPGVGKTSLAHHVAHAAGGQFPGGSLYAALTDAEANDHRGR